jgi:hypothetical protein
MPKAPWYQPITDGVSSDLRSLRSLGHPLAEGVKGIFGCAGYLLLFVIAVVVGLTFLMAFLKFFGWAWS